MIKKKKAFLLEWIGDCFMRKLDQFWNRFYFIGNRIAVLTISLLKLNRTESKVVCKIFNRSNILKENAAAFLKGNTLKSVNTFQIYGFSGIIMKSNKCKTIALFTSGFIECLYLAVCWCKPLCFPL